MRNIITFLLIIFAFQFRAQLCFKPPITHPNLGEWSTVSGDFNNDGFIDLASYSSNKDIKVLLGNGTGTLTFASTFSVSGRSSVNYPNELVARDFDNDGNLDIATIRSATNQISLFLGTGGGSFLSTGVTNVVGTQPAGLISSDFNNDGKVDLAVTNIGTKNVSVLLGTGFGSFNSAINFSTPLGIPKSITSGDFNNDGKKDLAIGIQTVSVAHKMAIFIGDGLGNFTAGANYVVSNNFPNSSATSDFNADGKLDIVCGKGGGTFVGVFLGLGSGTFNNEVTYNTLGGQSSTNVLCGDYNADGIVDIAAGCYSTNEVSVLLGNGGGGFNTALKYPAGVHPMSATSADFNNDGKLDIAVGLDLSGGINVLLNGPLSISVTGNLSICSGNNTILTVSGANTYTWSANAGSANTSTVSVSPVITSIYTVNVTNGSCPAPQKIVIVNVTSTPTVSISQSSFSGCRGGSATFTATGASSYTWSSNAGNSHSSTVTVSPTASSQYSVIGANGSCVNTTYSSLSVVPDLLFNGPNVFIQGTAAYSTISKDFNNDGKADIVYGDKIALGDGIGNFNSVSNIPINSAWSITAADFNNDGNLDLASANSNANVLVTLGNGNGTFLSPTTYIAGTLPVAITSADFNGDSKIDLAVANANTNNISIFIGTGTGSFSTANNFAIGNSSGSFASICSEDFNNDGKKDLAVSGSSGGYLLLGTGAGSFSPYQSIPIGATNSMIATDINNDSNMDLVFLSGNYVEVALGLGNGSFAANVILSGISAGVNAQKIISADFNGDNFKDVAVTDINANTVNVLLGSGNGAFGGAIVYNVFNGSGTVALTTADFTGNGTMDLAVGNYGPGGISILLNGLDINCGNTNICSGNNTIITSSPGFSSYNWSPNVGNTNTVTASPAITTTYSVTGVYSSCNYNLTNSITVNVTATPTLAILASNTLICLGSTAALSATGGTNYLWNAPGNSTLSACSFTPWHGSGIYDVSVSSYNGLCVGSSSISITVASPTIAIYTQTTCLVITSTLVATGANTYTWSTSEQNQYIIVNPLSYTPYSVTGTDIYGCSSTNSIVIGPNPTANFNYTVNNMNVHFTMQDSVNCTPSGHLWDYGNGAMSTSAVSPYVIYANPGVVTVCLSCNSLPSNCKVCTNITVPGNYSGATSYVGIEEIQENNIGVKIYPNPSNGFFTIESKNENKVTVNNVLGENIHSQNIQIGKNNLNLNNQPNGIYFIKIQNFTYKIIVQN